MVINKKTLQIIKKETIPTPIYQSKTITPQNQTHEITADSGYDALSKVILNGLLVDPHQSYTTQTDNTIAYQKTVPSGALGYATLDKLGGMSYKSENLAVLNDVAETTVNDITYKVENGVITLNGTASQQTKFSFEFLNAIPKNQNYYVLLFISGTTTATNPKAIGETSTDVRLLIPSTTTFNVNYDIKYFWFSAGNGTVWTNYVIKPMIIKGSIAPTEFKEGFTGLRHSAIIQVISKDENGNVIDTFNVPDEIQNKTGYGKGVNNNSYNYWDLDNDNYTQDDDDVDLGIFNYTLSTSSNRYLYATTFDDIKGQVSPANNINALSSMYNAVSTNKSWVDKDMAYTETNVGSKKVTFVNNDYTTSSDFKTAMSGVPLIYQLANAIVSSTTHVDNFIKVVAGGSLTFVNQYNQAVPSEITYLVEV